VAITRGRADAARCCCCSGCPRRAALAAITGRIEAGESPAAAAARELFEETGARLPVADLGYTSLRAGVAAPPVLAEEDGVRGAVGGDAPVRLSPSEHPGLRVAALDEALARVPYEACGGAARAAAGS